MYPKYKRPRFTESDEDEEEHVAPIIPTVISAPTDTADNLIRPYLTLPSRKRRRFTEESDDDEDAENSLKETTRSSAKEGTPLSSMNWAPTKSILKQQSIPSQKVRPSRSGPPTDREFRKVFISNIDATRPAEEARTMLLNLMNTHGIPCEQKVHILPPNISGRHHRGVAWITLDHQDDIDRAINRLSKTMFGNRIMKAKVHENPMLSATKAQASFSSSTPTFSVSRGGIAPTPVGGYAPTPVPVQGTIPPWQKKLTTPSIAPWKKKESEVAKKIFIWNIDNNKTEAESKAFIYQTLAAELGSDVVGSVSCRSKGMKVYAFVEFTRSTYVARALDVINGLKFGIKHLGAQVHQTRQGSRQSKDLDFNPW